LPSCSRSAPTRSTGSAARCAARGFQPVQVAENVPYERYAAVTVRLPELPGVEPARGFTRFYPAGAAVGQLIGYVGAASPRNMRKEKNPLLITPGFKIGKEGLEERSSSGCAVPGGQRVEVSARGKLIRELTPKPDRSGNTVQLSIDAGLQEYAARRLGEEAAAAPSSTARPATSSAWRPCRATIPTASPTGSAGPSGRRCRRIRASRCSTRR
jgi:cell division protein FtsI/penicillin-binding protein 2